MTNRETLRYMLAACALWALVNWRPIALAIGAAALMFILVGK